VVALLFTVIGVVAAIFIISTYSINQAVVAQKQEFRQEALLASEKQYLRIDAISFDGNYLSVSFTALEGPVELNNVSVFINHRFVGLCSDLNCWDQTDNGFLVTGESGGLNLPYNGPCLVTVTLEYLGSTSTSSDYVCGWLCRRPVTITSSFSQASYPVNVLLNSTNFDFNKSDGNDIRFTDLNGNLLPYWIEYWGTSSASIWVSVDVSAGDTNIYMYYCNPNAASESNGYNVFDVFNFDDTNLLAVFHFNEGTGSVTYDALGLYEGNLEGNTAWVQGRFGWGLSFDGNDDWVVTNFNGSYQEFTYLAFVYAYSPADGLGKVIHDGAWNRAVGVDSNVNPYVLFDSGGVPLYDRSVSVTGKWYHVAARVSGISLFQEIYVDGTLKGTSSITSLPARAGPTYFGTEGGAGYDYNGLMDEVILFGRLLTPEEINALSKGYFDFLTSVWVVRKRVDPEPTVTIGPEETGLWNLN